MKRAEIVQRMMFDYDSMSEVEIRELCVNLPKKIIRWLGAHHPDNRTRKIFFRLTNITIGEGTVINQNFIVSDGYAPLLVIGKRVAISPNVTVICESNPNNSQLQQFEHVRDNLICAKNILIDDDSWIGSNVVMLPGITIGKCSIVGAGSVVTKDVLPRTIVAGVPAVKIREFKRKIKY